MKQTLWNDGFIFVAFISILDTLSRLRSSIQTALCVFYYAPHTTYIRRKFGKERRASMNNIKWSDRCAYNAHKTVYNVKNTKEHINCRRKSYRQILKQSRNEKLFYTWKTSQYVNVCVCVCARLWIIVQFKYDWMNINEWKRNIYFERKCKSAYTLITCILLLTIHLPSNVPTGSVELNRCSTIPEINVATTVVFRI